MQWKNVCKCIKNIIIFFPTENKSSQPSDPMLEAIRTQNKLMEQLLDCTQEIKEMLKKGLNVECIKCV